VGPSACPILAREESEPLGAGRAELPDGEDFLRPRGPKAVKFIANRRIFDSLVSQIP